MGNCSEKTCSPCSSDRVRVWTESGQLIEFEGPRVAREVLRSFPSGYAIFRGGEMRRPLPDREELQNGRPYYALPLKKGPSGCRRRPKREHSMSPSTANGVWRVKLAISVEELEDILAGQVNNMETLIRQIRMRG